MMTATAGVSMTIGATIRELRLAKNLKQEQLAAAASEFLPRGETLAQGVLSQIEIGKIARPDPDKLRAIARALGVSYNDLLLRGWGDPVEARPASGQLSLDLAAAPAHERVLADLIELSLDRPDIRAAMGDLRDQLSEAEYRQALVIMWRNLTSAIETARAIFLPDDEGDDTRKPHPIRGR